MFGRLSLFLRIKMSKNIYFALLLAVLTASPFRAVAQDDFDVELSLEKLESSVMTLVTVTNTSYKTFYISSSLKYSAEYFSDSLVLFGASYLYCSYDILRMPELQLEFAKLQPGETLEFLKLKNSKCVTRVTIQFDYLIDDHGLPSEINEDLLDSEMMIKNIFSNAIKDNWKFIQFDLNSAGEIIKVSDSIW